MEHTVVDSFAQVFDLVVLHLLMRNSHASSMLVCSGLEGCVGLEIVAYVSTHKLSFIHLIGTLMRKSLISHAFLLSSFFYSHCIC